MSAPIYKEPTGAELDAIIAQHDGVRGDMAREIHALRQRCDAMPKVTAPATKTEET